jgi:hypothetical protein
MYHFTMKTKVAGLLLLSLAAGANLAHSARAGQSPGEEMSAVIAGLRSYREKVDGLRCLRATVVRYNSTPREINLLLHASDAPTGRFAPAGRDEETLDTARWYFQEARLSVLTEHATNNSEAARMRYRRLVVDGERALLLKGYDTELPAVPGGRSVVPFEGMIAPRQNVLVNGVFVEARELSPHIIALQGFGPRDQPLDQVLLNSDPPPVYAEDVLYGSRCATVRLRSAQGIETSYWIDKEHGFAIRQMEVRAPMGGKMVVVNRMQVPRLAKGDGLWLPALMEIKNYWPLRATKADKTGSVQNLKEGLAKIGIAPGRIRMEGDIAFLPPIVTRVTMSDLETGCDAPSRAFDLIWPQGTAVQDQITGKTFRSGAPSGGGKYEALSLRSLDKAAWQSAALSDARTGQARLRAEALRSLQFDGPTPEAAVRAYLEAVRSGTAPPPGGNVRIAHIVSVTAQPAARGSGREKNEIRQVSYSIELTAPESYVKRRVEWYTRLLAQPNAGGHDKAAVRASLERIKTNRHVMRGTATAQRIPAGWRFRSLSAKDENWWAWAMDIDYGLTDKATP